ncbi:hypothetical protein ACG5V6_18750 [Streptomyces chitinivorans]|uniref:DUF155 domain-containing protein n=1 Tax=Streptomyces chitinivorans TaxID=1257027 RepID=A0ABW7HWF3_9ACTN|nr:hypothetical protein [Streptomyces chitinivorans]MDH2410586.1 hypothetical protein [Streptomyces chitinivorans]
MQVVLIAPFLMRFRLCANTFGGEVGRALREAVTAAVPGFSPQADGPDSPLLFDYHMSTGGSRLSGKRTVGTVDLEGAGLLWCRFEPSGYCYVMQTVEVPDKEEMHRRERELVERVNPHIARWTESVSEHMLATGLVDPVEGAEMDPGRLLWWHRVLMDPPRGQEPGATRVYGVERQIHDDAYVRFGDGFTTLVRLPRHRINEVLEGVMAATSEWIAVDEANRLVSARMLGLNDTRWNRVADVDRQFTASLKLSKDLALRDMVRLEESRYTVNAGAVVVDAAMERWAMDRERGVLEVQLQSLRDILDFHRNMTQYRRDERRNRLLFVFTAIALFQSVLVWYDFAHESNNTLGPAERLAVVSAIAVLTVVVVVSSLAARRRE